jgi:hypothetical protein
MEQKTLNYFRILFLTAALPYFVIVPFIPYTIAGFNLTGWGWVIVFLFSLFYLVITPQKTFPVSIWLPWILYLVIYLICDFSFYGFQLSLQYIVSILVGWIASGLVYTSNVLITITKWFKYLIIFLVIFSLQFYIRTYGIKDISYGASLVMTIVLAATLVITDYFLRNNITALRNYLFLSVIPFIQVTRMGMLMIIAVASLHFANRRIGTKIGMVILTLIIGLSVFYSDSFQKKSFYSGSGNISDLVNYHENNDFNANGRTYLYNLVQAGIAEKPVWGHGPRADLILLKRAGSKLTEVHNDYLAVRYNYGVVGLVLLFVGITLQFFDLLKIAKKSQNYYFQVAVLTSLTLFIPLFGFMYSDNILKYSLQFGNFHFALTGIAYALLKNEDQWIYR